MKSCPQCGTQLTSENWLESSKKKSWYICNNCKRARARDHYRNNKQNYYRRAKANFGPVHNEWNRYSQLKERTPAWASRGYIRLWYMLADKESARTGRAVTVDHIIPIHGEDVCGLHVEDNLQLLFKEDNSRKGINWREFGWS